MTSCIGAPSLPESLEGVILGYGEPPLQPPGELAAIAWDLRALCDEPFIDPSSLVDRLGLSVTWWSGGADLLVHGQRIVARRTADARERGTVISMGVSVVSLRSLALPFNDTDAAVLACEVLAPARVAERGTIDALARLQPSMTVGLLAAWRARCRSESMPRKKKTGTDSGT